MYRKYLILIVIAKFRHQILDDRYNNYNENSNQKIVVHFTFKES